MMRMDTFPFPHLIQDRFEADLCREASALWPAPDWPDWTVHYDNPLERKRVCNNWQAMPEPCRELLRRLLFLPVEHYFDGPCVPDLALWGGGMHSMERGGHLDLHLDADTHPASGLRRRLNAVLFLSGLTPAWGGALEFWDRERKGAVVTIQPAPARLVVFETGDYSYHGVPAPLRCPPKVQRKTLAVWWYMLPHGPSVRARAQFVDPAGQHDPIKDALRAARP